MMRRLIGISFVLAACTLPLACGPDDADATEAEEVLKAREARLAEAIAKADSDSGDDKPLARWMLPNRLKEISGIVLTKDGRLLTHGDETAEITEIDYTRGMIVKQFLVGSQVIRD